MGSSIGPLELSVGVDDDLSGDFGLAYSRDDGDVGDIVDCGGLRMSVDLRRI